MIPDHKVKRVFKVKRVLKDQKGLKAKLAHKGHEDHEGSQGGKYKAILSSKAPLKIRAT